MHAYDAPLARRTPLTPPHWDLYRHAVVDIRFPDLSVRVEPRPRGTALGHFPEPAGTAAVHVVTAWNPRGLTAPDADNARAQGLLLDEVRRRGLTWWAAVGGDAPGTHREESVAVTGLSDAEARALGYRFGQDAVFAWSADAWRVLACDSDASDVNGWAVTARSGDR
ncbi:DUF3293 domain-containing protein [Streptomyces sp. NBC_00820]|uniref:DUF3293 domain-containing protein n=1 Tax=Streptomyces sp. NBC_00820 TaxID=2975842 RepID=UPI002ED5AF35|nr:DUF3293 domain-containing protein [Streptomyces sp. NBC_00820]